MVRSLQHSWCFLIYLFIFFKSLCPIPLCPFVLLAWKGPDRGQVVSSNQGVSAKPHAGKETPLFGLNRHKMVIRPYLQPLHHMALKITGPSDGQGLWKNLECREPWMLSSLGMLTAVVSSLSSGSCPICTALSGGYPICTTLSRTGK